MAYQAGTATSIADLFTQLSTFAVANGWTQDYASTDRMFLSRNNVYVSFRWATTSPAHVGIYQALGFINSATQPGSHTNDSGQGAIGSTDAILDDGRNVRLVNSTMRYWFFEEDVYIHVVAETTTGTFRQFGFGELVKFGTWTGGEYAYGDKVTTVNDALATADTGSFLLDGRAGYVVGATRTAIQPYVASLHCESLPGQAASSKWGLVWSGSTPTTNDRGGNSRVFVLGGFRSGMIATSFARFSASPTNGLLPMYPIQLFYRNSTNAYPLGYMEDVRGVNIANFVGGDEITVGADTWVLFPTLQKGTTAGTYGASRNQGIAYRKVI